MAINDWVAQNWEGITAVVVGGWLAYTQYSNYKKNKSEDRFERELSYSKRIETRAAKLEEDKERLQNEIVNLRIEAARRGTPPVEVLKTIVSSDHGLMWAKERTVTKDGKVSWIMVACSYGYARMYLGGAHELYEGKSDFDIYPEEIAKIFHANDEEVHLSQMGRNVREKVDGAPTGIWGFFVGRKYNLRLPDGRDYLVGTGYHEADGNPISSHPNDFLD